MEFPFPPDPPTFFVPPVGVSSSSQLAAKRKDATARMMSFFDTITFSLLWLLLNHSGVKVLIRR
jgi:hypothetical protein